MKLNTVINVLCLAALILVLPAFAHDVSDNEKLYVQSTQEAAIIPFMYLGAKHMVTGIDHMLFLTGVVLFLVRLKDIVLIVSLFTLGHSITLIAGVLSGFSFNIYLIDALIGLSVVYKGIENAGVRFKVDRRVIVLGFGLIHGLGLASRMLDLSLSEQGLMANLLAFNAGVEIGQIIILFLVINLIAKLRSSKHFSKIAQAISIFLVIAGILLMLEQCLNWLTS